MLGGNSLHFARGSFERESDLASALVRAGALSSAPYVREAQLREAAVLKGAIVRATAARARGEALGAADVDTINSFAGDEPPAPVLRRDGTAVRTAIDAVRAGLAAVARDAIEVLAGADPLRACESCGAAFIDRSRGARRRWCSMSGCGNRVKVAAYRRRRAAGG